VQLKPAVILPTPSVAKSPSRNAVNEVIAGRLYQRGQILTWQREKKYRILQDLGIKTVVNFWPKLDPDMGEAGINYLHLPAVQSEQMLERRMETTARLVAQLSEEGAVLALCEAGMTRSVYFCVLLVSQLLGISPHDAHGYVTERIHRTSLKRFMLDRLAQQKSPVVKPGILVPSVRRIV